jgi:hypothetical protein
VDEVLSTTQAQMDEIILTAWLHGILMHGKMERRREQFKDLLTALSDLEPTPTESGEIRSMGEVLPAVDGTIDDETDICADCTDKECPKHPEFKVGIDE